MLYGGGEKSTVTKYGTCMPTKHEQSTARGKKSAQYVATMI